MSGIEGNSKLHFIASVYVAIPLCIFGLIGNLISIIIWNRINKKRSSAGKSAGLYLIALALVDSGLLIFFLTTETTLQINPSLLKCLAYIRYHAYIGYPLYFFFIVASIWMVICVTVNRFIAVVFPHKAPHLNSVKTTYVCIGMTLLFAFAINAPHFAYYGIQKVNSSEYKEIKTSYFGVTKSSQYYDFWAHCMMLVLIPWVTIFCLNVVIIYKITKKKSLRKVGGQSRERQTTITLLVVTFAFLIFLLWQCLVQCFWMLNYGKHDEHVWYNVDSSYAFGRLGVAINSSINFILYCLTGTMFRNELKSMWLELRYNQYESLDNTIVSRTISTYESNTEFHKENQNATNAQENPSVV